MIQNIEIEVDIMPITLLVILEAALIASSLSIDAFSAGFAYGSGKTRIPMLSVQIINNDCIKRHLYFSAW